MAKARTWLCSCATIVLPIAAHAQTTVSSAQSTPITTSTADSGVPGDVSITSDGSITLPSGTAVTIDSDNAVANAGTISISDADGAIGILANAGVTSSIDNSGTITIDESYEATDSDDDGDLDGAFAIGTSRYGIRTLGGFTGSIANSGTITIEGNDSGGIVLGGTLDGSLNTSGTISVLGDGSYGIHTGAVTGDVTLEGSISAKGDGAIGFAADGTIGGALVIQGSVTATGYRYTTTPDDVTTLDSDDLLQGGPAVRIRGSVAGGIMLAVPPTDTDSSNDDEDGDGVTDSDEGTAIVSSYGAAPAMLIGGTGDITIGAVASDADGHGLVNQGYIYGFGFYSGVDGNALVIGGQGGAVTITGGIANSGTIYTSSFANSTALHLESGADAGLLDNSGTISAISSGGETNNATAIRIDSGASLQTLTNSGTIGANGGGGAGIAVIDESGTLSTITNSGAIYASGGSTVSNIAFDLRANTGGVTLLQEDLDTSDTSAPSIIGDLMFGGGANVVTIIAGSVAGDADFGTGSANVSLSGSSVWSGDMLFHSGGNSVSLADTASFAGTMDFAGLAASLTLDGSASFSGTLANSGNLALRVNGGTFVTGSSGTVELGSLDVGSSGVLGVTIDGNGVNTLYQVSGAASFAAGSKIKLDVSKVIGTDGSYVIVDAASVSGAPEEEALSGSLPYLFVGDVWTSANQVGIDIRRRTASELGLNKWESAIYEPAMAVLDSDSAMAGVFLEAGSAGAIASALRQMLPDHGGGTFELVTAGSRATLRFLEDYEPAGEERHGVGVWLQQVGWGTAKGRGDTASYSVGGWGTALGANLLRLPLGEIGASFAYLAGRNADHATDNEVDTNQYELSAFWRLNTGPLRGYLRGTAAMVDFDSGRWFVGTADGTSVKRSSNAQWGGSLYSAGGGISYAIRANRFTLRPIGSFDYYRLHENGRTETGGGSAFDLAIDARTSDELAATGSLALSYDLRRIGDEGQFFRVEIEGGRRMVVGGALAPTVARFAGGASFVLEPEARTDGWMGRVRLTGGSPSFSFSAEASAEQQQGYAGIGARATLRTAF